MPKPVAFTNQVSHLRLCVLLRCLVENQKACKAARSPSASNQLPSTSQPSSLQIFGSLSPCQDIPGMRQRPRSEGIKWALMCDKSRDVHTEISMGIEWAWHAHASSSANQKCLLPGLAPMPGHWWMKLLLLHMHPWPWQDMALTIIVW